jgi:hypothetical protein
MGRVVGFWPGRVAHSTGGGDERGWAANRAGWSSAPIVARLSHGPSRRPPQGDGRPTREGGHVGARRCVVLWRGRACRRSVALAARGEACRPAIHEPVDRSPARARVPTAGRPPPAEVRRPDRPSDGRDSVSGRSRGSRPRRSPHVRRRRRCRHSRARASDCRISVGTSAPTST